MKCLIDIRSLLSDQRAGVGQYTYNLTAELLKRPSLEGRNYNMFGPGWNRQWPNDLPEESKNIKYTHPKIPNRLLNISVGLTGRPTLEKLAGDFDVAWMPNLNFSSTNKPYVITVHDLSFIRYPEFFSIKQRLWHSMANPKKLYGEAARLIAVSEHTKLDLIETYGISQEKISVINPAAGDLYKAPSRKNKEEVAAKYGLPEKFFLYLGTIEPRKNIDGLINAFEALDTDAYLIIAGGKGWLWRETFRAAESSPASDRIKFIDYVEEQDKPAIYSQAIALTYPSFYEGFGMPPLEAMSCGCPVIASYASSLGEVVGKAGLLVDPHDLNDISHAMQLVLDSDDLRSVLISQGLEQAKKFSWQTSAEKLDILLSEFH